MKILFLPIDIEIPKLDSSKINSSILKEGRYQPYWKTVDITTNENDELKLIFDQLPIDQITNVYYKEQTKFAKPHYDVYSDMKFEVGEYENILQNEPAGYRIVIEGNNNRLYVKSHDDFKPAILPSIPGCYLLNSTEGLHMVKDDPGRKIIYIRGFINPEKHRLLIKRSFEKYKNLAIIE